jgi:hypothetical protein
MGENFGLPRIGAVRGEICQIGTGLASADWTKIHRAAAASNSEIPEIHLAFHEENWDKRPDPPPLP